MEIIARIRTDFPQKFGIPRQSGLVPELRGHIVFEPEYAREEAVRGLDGFSHIWILWKFEDTERHASGQTRNASTETLQPETRNHEDSPLSPEASDHPTPQTKSWQPMVRPPLLGGNKQMGVFATRSPFRPNNIGLSCVRLEHVETSEHGPILHVRGADLRDNTPIYDIKPYLPSADCHPDATGGFTDTTAWQRLSVECPPELLECMPADARDALLGVLAEDPRPARQRTHEAKSYTLAFAGFDIRFSVSDAVLTVLSIDCDSFPQ